ncbi:universal stress protein [Natronorubrum texcoconense]|uniref:Universal stress protein family protein n=1 Tax=Natronorubrum texcoconense TaxID=1095776 RepID=A0A1G8VMI5_9EURY|nr:universal stress protein [Natronorubrum texcoconense]SDJ67222.1 hypothetical protein SAMN04515672_1411 [Natronorubrum texcoconense]
MTTILVPVRYPLSEHSYRTIERGLDHISGDDSGSLILLHVRLLQQGRSVSRTKLRKAVQQRFGEIPAHYVVRSGYILEEAIIDEAVRQDADRVVIGISKTRSLKRKVSRLLKLDLDLELILENELDVELEVVE